MNPPEVKHSPRVEAVNEQRESWSHGVETIESWAPESPDRPYKHSGRYYSREALESLHAILSKILAPVASEVRYEPKVGDVVTAIAKDGTLHVGIVTETSMGPNAVKVEHQRYSGAFHQTEIWPSSSLRLAHPAERLAASLPATDEGAKPFDPSWFDLPRDERLRVVASDMRGLYGIEGDKSVDVAGYVLRCEDRARVTAPAPRRGDGGEASDTELRMALINAIASVEDQLWIQFGCCHRRGVVVDAIVPVVNRLLARAREARS